MANQLTRDSRSAQAAPMPGPGDFDDVDPDSLAIEATGRTHGPMAMVIPVTLEREYVRAIVQAAHAEGLDAAEYVQRAVRRLGEQLRDGAAFQ